MFLGIESTFQYYYPLFVDIISATVALAVVGLLFMFREEVRKAFKFSISKSEDSRATTSQENKKKENNEESQEVRPCLGSSSPTSNENPPRRVTYILPAIDEDCNMDKQYNPMSRGFDTQFESDSLNGYIDDTDETSPKSSNTSSHPSPTWIDGPRDITTLPEIIISTYSEYDEESDYAMKQMLAILESLHPVDDFLDFFENGLKAVEDRLPSIIYKENGHADWSSILEKIENEQNEDPLGAEHRKRRLSVVQMTAVFDALPFLFETVASFDSLQRYQDVLSMMIVLALSGNAMIRRQCISAITILTERSLLSQDFMRVCVVPGLFFVYKSGVGAYQSNDLRAETVQALCHMITYETIHDREWIFLNFVPKFSMMLKDTAMHVRKSAILVFGSLGNMFGEKFTESFLVPHLISQSLDLNWAVRKAACEIFVRVAECSPRHVRSTTLSNVFVRLLSDPNKWVSFVAYQHLGAFIALFANSDITGLEMVNGEVVVREDFENTIPTTENSFNSTSTTNNEEKSAGSSSKNTTEIFSDKDESLNDFGTLPEGTYLPVDVNEEDQHPIRRSPDISVSKTVPAIPTIVKTPKRGERVMGSVISGLNKMLSFDRISSPKTSPSLAEKKPTLSLQGAMTLMDKWSMRNSPNNQQRFIGFAEPQPDIQESTETLTEQPTTETFGSGGIAAKCSSSDDLSKLGLDEEVVSPSKSSKSLRTSRTFNVRERLFLKRLGALPASPKRSSKKSLWKRHNQVSPSKRVEKECGKNEKAHRKEKYSATSLTKLSDDDEDNLDQSFMMGEEDEEGTDNSSGERNSKPSRSSPQKNEESPISNEFSLTYWSADCAIDCNEDELEPFGSSTDSPTSISYLENRLDVMKIHSPRARSLSFGSNSSPLRGSPRRNTVSSGGSPKTLEAEVETAASPIITTNSSISQSNLNTTEELLRLNIFEDCGEMEMSISSNSSLQGEGPTSEDADVSMTSSEAAIAFQHVPHDLVDAYMCVIGNASNASMIASDPSLSSEIYRHCAYNFPAVCYTLGRPAWPKLKHVFAKLALDEQARVRQSISNSIHEIAKMFGTEIADNDLLPIFYDLRNDQNVDVRSGILSHLYDFVKCLSTAKRAEMILSLPQFFPIGAQPGNVQNGDWRSRYELISQLAKLCSLYSIEDVNVHMSGIALTLADDRVAEVRREAVILVATIVGALVKCEWERIKANRDLEKGHVDVKALKVAGVVGPDVYLSEQFIDDIVVSFANTQKWTRRQTFCFICAQVLKDSHCDGEQFRYFFVNPLQKLVMDKVPNVRLAAGEAISIWKKSLLANRSDYSEKLDDAKTRDEKLATLRRDMMLVSEAMSRLADDDDVDASFMARKCQGWASDTDPVNVKSRTNRMRQRESAFFGDLVLSDDSGKIVRVSADGRREISVIKAPIAVAEQDVKVLDDYGNDSNNEEPPTSPPMICAKIENIELEEWEDDTEVVDMEIDEPEEEKKEVEKEEKKDTIVDQKEDEVDIPMDPSPTKVDVHAKSPEESEA